MSDESLPEIPDSWKLVNLIDISFVISGKTPKGISSSENGTIPFFKVKDMNTVGNEKFMFKSDIYFTDEDVKKFKLNIQKEGTVIFPKRGGAISTNKKRILSEPSAYDLNIMGVNSVLVPYTYIYYWISSIELISLADGSNVPQINHKDIEPLLIPLPPLDEQKRIVNKVEELFTKLDAGIQELTRAKEKLKVYRQSVLKHAFEGKLTEEWREARKDEIESASNFLKNIENERIKESKTKKKSAVPDTSELSKIPDEWEWTYLESIIFNHDKSRIPVKSADRKEMSGIYPYYGASGIIDYVDNYLFDGEYLLIGEDGANLLSRSKPIAFLAKGQFWVNNHAHVLQTRGNMPLSYLEHYINSIDLKLFVTGSAQPKLTQRSMNKIPIKIPPSDEQKIIAEEIDAKFSLIEDIEKNLNENLIKANNLRQSILKKAFTGQLVHQDPNDEPAEQLLERIKAQKEKQKPQRKSKQKRLVK